MNSNANHSPLFSLDPSRSTPCRGVAVHDFLKSNHDRSEVAVSPQSIFSSFFPHLNLSLRLDNKHNPGGAMKLTFLTELGESYLVEIGEDMELENVMALLEAEVSSNSYLHNWVRYRVSSLFTSSFLLLVRIN